jgi:hypothetical protein
MESGQVAAIEADCELAVVSGGQGELVSRQTPGAADFAARGRIVSPAEL